MNSVSSEEARVAFACSAHDCELKREYGGMHVTSTRLRDASEGGKDLCLSGMGDTQAVVMVPDEARVGFHGSDVTCKIHGSGTVLCAFVWARHAPASVCGALLLYFEVVVLTVHRMYKRLHTRCSRLGTLFVREFFHGTKIRPKAPQKML